MNIQLNLDAEQTAALEGVVARRNAANSTAITPAQHLAEICVAEVLRYVETAYEEASRQLVEAARALSYEQRQQLMAGVQQQLEANP